ncbi:peptidoglycan binding protein, partial [Listeria monocytogenes FSL F2-208]
MNLSSFRVSAEEKGNESLSYEVQKELSSDNKKANLTIKTTPKSADVKI